MNTMIFSNIPAIINRDIVLRRLRYKKNVTIIDSEQLESINKSIDLGVSLCELKGILGRFKIVQREVDFVIIENKTESLNLYNNSGIKIESRSLAKLLENSSEILIMAATVGNDIVEKILYEVNNGNGTLGVIMDSVASEATNASVEWIKEFADKMLRREGKRVTKHRYSPGFNEFSLLYQKIFFELLGLEKIGLSLTDMYMLMPEKSVIAVAGIEADIEYNSLKV